MSQCMDNDSTQDYNEQLKQNFEILVNSLDLDDLQKAYFTSRWLDQVMWLEKRARQMRNWHQRLRIGAIIVSAIVPVLITINFHENKNVDKWLKVLTVGISATVTVAGAVEEFSQFGDKWYRYRKAAELLKSQGWSFIELSSTYSSHKTHRLAFRTFAENIETIIQRDVEIYVEESLQHRMDNLNLDINDVEKKD
jgi:hypothetical protein